MIILEAKDVPPDLAEYFEPITETKFDTWRIATTPYSGAHFATFPPALVEPCILAGTSAAGQCPHCGAPWERVVEKNGGNWESRKASGAPMRYGQNNNKGQAITNYGGSYSTTLTWRPTCACPEHTPVPQLVLDPFGGAGTTALVALRHGRRAVLLDLNAAYLVLARERLAPLLAQPRLFETAILGYSQEVQ